MAAKKFNWVKGLVIILVLACIGAGVVWYLKRDKEAPVDFRTTTVARGEITQTVTANGGITPVKTVQVGSQVSGIIQEIRVDFNTKVSSNQVIAQIDPSTVQQTVDQAEAELLSSKASLELNELNYRRATNLLANKLIAVSDADKALADLHQAQASVRTREASLRSKKVDLDHTTIYAPIDGVVISRAVEVGQTVASSFNTPTLFQIANDLSKMEIDAMVSEADVGGVVEGQPVLFTVDAYPNRQFKGSVRQVRFAPTTNQNVVTYTTVIEVSNEDLKLRPGMTANLNIVTSQKENVLKIPNAALRVRPPESVTLKAPTNELASAKGTNGAAKSGDASLPANFASMSREERQQYMQSLSPEQRTALRGRMGGGGRRGGGGEEGGRGNGNGGSQLETPGIRTVYLLVKSKLPSGAEVEMAKPVTIRTGISDSMFTEVVEGLSEGDEVITSVTQSTASASAARPGSSPFGGGMGGGFRGR